MSLLAPPATANEYDLTASDKRPTFRVEVTLKVGGDLRIRRVEDLTAVKEGEDGQVRRLPMSVEGTLSYEERRLDDQRSARRYAAAEAIIKVEKGGKKPSLPAHKRLILAEQTNQRVLLSSPEGPLTREELDLIDVVGATPVLDRILPGKKLREGESWAVEADVMGPLLGLDEVSLCEVSNVVDEGNASYVKFQIAGAVHGEVDGAPTEFDVRGLGLFDRRWGCVTKLNLAVKERRDLGPATPGFVGVGKANISREPTDEPELLTEDVLERLATAKQDASLRLTSDKLGMRLQHDRGWFVATESRSTLALRRVDKSGLAAQATFTRLPAKSAQSQPSLEEFESQVRLALGDSLSEVLSSEQWVNQSDQRCLCVVARGHAADMDLEWRHYLVQPPGGGHSISLTTTLAVADMAAVGGADRQLADTLELISKQAAEVAQQTGETVAK